MSAVPDPQFRSLIPKRKHKEPGGRIIQSYSIASWVVLRLYGVALLYTAALFWTGALMPDGYLRGLGLAPDPYLAAFAMAGLGLLLALPFLTPRVLRYPDTIFGGCVKAVLMLLLSGVVYLAASEILLADIFRFGARFESILPTAIKAIAGLSVTGSVLVSLASALTAGEAMRASEDPKSLSPDDLRALRKSRTI